MSVVISGLPPIIVTPATLYIPGGVGLPYHEHQFDVHFRRFGSEEYEALAAKVASGSITVAEFCDEAVVGWGKMLDGSGAEVPYDHIVRQQANDEYGGIDQAIAVAFLDLYGAHQREAAIKNFTARSAIASASTAQKETSSAQS